MKRTKCFSLLLALSLLLAMSGCGAQEQPTAATTEATEPTQQTTEATTEATEPDLSSDTTHKYLTDDPVLIARREAVEAHMRASCNFIWRNEEDLLYTVSSGITPDQATGSSRLELKAGRLYRGLPYSFAGTSMSVFLEYLSEPDEKGIRSLSGMDWQIMSGGSKETALVGTDCYGAIVKAWGQVNASIIPKPVRTMVPANGYLRVGNYTSGEDENPKTEKVCEANGEQTMYEAYALLQAADMIIYTDHAMMVAEVRVVRDATGAIDPFESTITILEQTRNHFRDQVKHYNETLGEDVYEIAGIDRVFKFRSLYNTGYIPVTCKELIDPTPIAEPQITDSQATHTLDTLFTGVLSCNWYMDNVFVTITDQNGTVVQKLNMVAQRGGSKEINLETFSAEYPLRVQGALDPDALAPGQYRCTMTVRLGSEEEFIIRDFPFTR